MSEEKMREALELICRVTPRRESAAYEMWEIALKALAQQSALSEQMREALELADAALSGANMNMNVVERKVKAALAQQPAAGVELTDEELTEVWVRSRMIFTYTGSLEFARAVIAAHIAKQGGAA